MSAAAGWSDEVEAAYESSVLRYYEEQAIDADPTASETTIRTNTELVPHRADNLLRLVREVCGIEDLGGLRLLEAGAGFGALAAYLALTQRPAEVVGIDLRAEMVRAANRVATECQLPGVSFLVSDMRELSELPSGRFHLATVNNALLYVTDPGDVARTVSALGRVLRPGGAVLIYQANRWRWRDPFSKDPIMHLLPRRAAPAVARLTGWTNNQDRVRLQSSWALSRALRRSGFSSIAVATLRHGKVESGRRAHFAGWIAVGGRREGEGSA